jgi:hypothetical protein
MTLKSRREAIMNKKRGPRYSKEEFARRGNALYETKVRPNLKKKDDGKFVAIDIETGEYAIATKELTACKRLEARLPDPQTWLMRIGSKYLYTFGGSCLEDNA